MCQQDLKKYDSIRIAGIVRESIVDGPGLRFAVFCQGCPHGCPGCHNQETHDFNGGYDCDISKIVDAVDKDPLLDGVTFSGGEPFCQPGAFSALAEEIKKRGLNIMAYSGYTYEELTAKGESVDFETLKNEIAARDKQDSTREVAPLKKAEDAILIDTSDMTIDQVLETIKRKMQEKI